jgi:hypothetical protein
MTVRNKLACAICGIGLEGEDFLCDGKPDKKYDVCAGYLEYADRVIKAGWKSGEQWDALVQNKMDTVVMATGIARKQALREVGEWLEDCMKIEDWSNEVILCVDQLKSGRLPKEER